MRTVPGFKTRNASARQVWRGRLIGAVALVAIPVAMNFASSAGAATATNLAGTWTLVEQWNDTSPPSTLDATYTFTETAPGVYSVSNGAGWVTTNVSITGTPGETFSVYFCNNPATISETDQGACVVSIGGYWIEDFTVGPVVADRYTFSGGTFQEYSNENSTVGEPSGTFTGTGPLVLPPSVTVSVLPKSAEVLVGHEITVDLVVKAGPVTTTDVDLGSGLTSNSVVKVLGPPKDMNGFTLNAGQSRTFRVVLKGERHGTASLAAHVSATSGGLAVSGSASTRITVRT